MLAVGLPDTQLDLGLLVPLIGFLGLAVSFVVIDRLARGEDEPVAPWRYRDLASDPALVHPRIEERRHTPRTSRPDLRAARRRARFLLGMAIALPFIVLLFWLMQPGTIGPMLDESPWYATALPWSAAIGYLLGLGWMIYRADPEPGTTTWRYRDH